MRSTRDGKCTAAYPKNVGHGGAVPVAHCPIRQLLKDERDDLLRQQPQGSAFHKVGTIRICVPVAPMQHFVRRHMR